MKYFVYILKSTRSGKLYKGYTTNLEQRLQQHNIDKSCHTDKTDGPFELLWSSIFTNKNKALQFEQYIKSGSGRAFVKKHLI
jgi:putative endonuclease